MCLVQLFRCTEMKLNLSQRRKETASFFKWEVKSPSQSETGKIETEMGMQLFCDTDPDTDPLQWWKHYEANFPRLSDLAKKYLSISNKRAPSEMVWGGVEHSTNMLLDILPACRQHCVCGKNVYKKNCECSYKHFKCLYFVYNFFLHEYIFFRSHLFIYLKKCVLWTSV